MDTSEVFDRLPLRREFGGLFRFEESIDLDQIVDDFWTGNPDVSADAIAAEIRSVWRDLDLLIKEAIQDRLDNL